MKKFSRLIPILLALTVLLAACGGSRTPIDNEPEAPITTGETESPTSLVVYFSWSGNTQQMSQWIADESGSDIYRVTPAEEYGPEFDDCADRAKNELDNGIRPALDNLLDAALMAQYDTIYVGFPIWWYDLPMVMTAFLEQYDLSGKTIIPYFSHNGSSSGASSLETLAEICVGATVRTDDALSISGSRVENAEERIREWVNGL